MFMKKARHCAPVAGLAVLLLTATLAGQNKGKTTPIQAPPAIKVDGNVIKEYVAYMASPEREGRKSLTPGFEKTVEWAASKFKEWGLKPGGDGGSFLQNVAITGPRSAFAWNTGVPELRVDGRSFYMKDGDFALGSNSTPGTQASGEIVFVGYGISAAAKGLDEYAGLDVSGKIVLAFKGSPKDAPTARSMFGPAAPEPKAAEVEAWTEESRDAAKIKTAYDKGAAAIMLFSPEKLAQIGFFGPQPLAAQPQAQAFMGMQREPVDASPYTRPFLIISDTNERIFKHIMWRDPQESPRGFSRRIDQIRRDIRDKKASSRPTGIRAEAKGYASTAYYGEKFKNNISHNVIGKVEGTDPVLKSQIIVVGGHMDHLGMTDGVVYNGADDDASGAALTMEMARLVASNYAAIKPKRTIVFALWCGEEMGLLGSNYFAKNPPDGIKLENVVVNFNADMVGLGERIGAPGALNFPSIFDVIMKNQDPGIAALVDPSTAGPGGSDYSAFIEQGIEALALMTSGGVGHPDYHDANDDIEKIDPEILRKTGQFVLQGLINVANETTVNLIVPDRLHLYNGMRLNPVNLSEARGGGAFRMGIGQQSQAQGPRLNIALNDVAAFGGNIALIDMAAKLLNVGRVDVPARGDGQWFSAGGLTERGKSAVAAFQSAGVALNLFNPSPRLLEDILDATKKGIIISGLAALPAQPLAKKIAEKNALVALEFEPGDASGLASRLMEWKKLMGGSGNLLLVTRESANSPRDESSPTGEVMRRKQSDEAKQQMYLALIKAGWTKDEIYAMAGVSPQSGERQMPPGGGRLGGNLSKLAQ